MSDQRRPAAGTVGACAASSHGRSARRRRRAAPRPARRPRSAASASVRTTSAIATGCVRVSTQRGAIMTGRRFTRWRMISKDALPAPITIAARTWTSGGPVLGAAARRPRRGSAGAPRRRRRARGRPGRSRARRRRRSRPRRSCAAAARSRSAKSSSAARAHGVDQVVGGAHAVERLGEPVAASASPWRARRRRAGRRAGSRTRARTSWPRREQLGEQVRADVAGGTGEEDGLDRGAIIAPGTAAGARGLDLAGRPSPYQEDARTA